MKNAVKGSDLSKARRLFVLIFTSLGSTILFQPIYMRYSFYTPMLEGFQLTNTQLGNVGFAYGLFATIFYLIGGVLADKVRCKYLATIGFACIAGSTFYLATLPSYRMIWLVFAFYGLASTGIYWGIRYKLIRLVSSEDSYSTNIGISYGLYGAGGLVYNSITLLIMNAAASAGMGLRTALIVYASMNVLFAVIAMIFIPKFADEKREGASFNLDELKEAIVHPGVWLTTFSMFFTYGVYAALTYTTSFLTDVFIAPLSIVATVGAIRSYGIGLLSSPILGGFATKSKSPSKVMIIVMLGAAVICAVLAFLPGNSSLLIFAIILILIAGFFSNGAYGICSSQFTESGVRKEIFGTATGILSVIAFIPDMFVYPMAGRWIDRYSPEIAYRYIFFFIIAFGIVAALMSVLLRIYVKRKNLRKTIETDENAQMQVAAGK